MIGRKIYVYFFNGNLYIGTCCFCCQMIGLVYWFEFPVDLPIGILEKGQEQLIRKIRLQTSTRYSYQSRKGNIGIRRLSIPNDYSRGLWTQDTFNVPRPRCCKKAVIGCWPYTHTWPFVLKFVSIRHAKRMRKKIKTNSELIFRCFFSASVYEYYNLFA